MNKKLLLISLFSFLLLGCGGPSNVKPELLTTMSRVAIVTATLEKVGQGENNDLIQSQAAEYAAKAYREKLSAIPGWNIVKLPNQTALAENFTDLASSKVATDVLVALAEQDQLPGKVNGMLMAQLTMAALRGNADDLESLKKKAISGAVNQLQFDIDQGRKKIAWSKDTIGIPSYSANRDEKMRHTYSIIRDRILEAYRVENNLDGIVLIHQVSAVGSPGDMRVIVQGNRILSSLKLNPSITILSSNSELAYSAGSSNLDDLAPMKFAVPIYVNDKSNQKHSLNLNDPKGDTLSGYKELIDDTSDDIKETLLESITTK